MIIYKEEKMFHNVNTPTPIGCLIGFFAIFPSIFSGIAFWGAYKAFSKEPPVVETGWKLILWGAVALTPALFCIGFCIYRIATSHSQKHYDISNSLTS
jgi:uncharacterized BrkB/YihY/UPF0761 family membrane protein